MGKLNFAKLEWNVIKAIICRRAGKFRRLFMCVQLKKRLSPVVVDSHHKARNCR